MATGDPVILVRTADGHLVPLDVTATSSAGENCILVRTADGYLVPVTVTPMSEKDDQGFLVRTADGYLVPVVGGVPTEPCAIFGTSWPESDGQNYGPYPIVDGGLEWYSDWTDIHDPQNWLFPNETLDVVEGVRTHMIISTGTGVGRLFDTWWEENHPTDVDPFRTLSHSKVTAYAQFRLEDDTEAGETEEFWNTTSYCPGEFVWWGYDFDVSTLQMDTAINTPDGSPDTIQTLCGMLTPLVTGSITQYRIRIKVELLAGSTVISFATPQWTMSSGIVGISSVKGDCNVQTTTIPAFFDSGSIVSGEYKIWSDWWDLSDPIDIHVTNNFNDSWTIEIFSEGEYAWRMWSQQVFVRRVTGPGGRPRSPSNDLQYWIQFADEDESSTYMAGCSCSTVDIRGNGNFAAQIGQSMWSDQTVPPETVIRTASWHYNPKSELKPISKVRMFAYGGVDNDCDFQTWEFTVPSDITATFHWRGTSLYY